VGTVTHAAVCQVKAMISAYRWAMTAAGDTLLKHLGYVGPQMTESYAQNDPYGTCVKTEGEDMLNRTVTSNGPSLLTILEALWFDSNQKV